MKKLLAKLLWKPFNWLYKNKIMRLSISLNVTDDLLTNMKLKEAGREDYFYNALTESISHKMKKSGAILYSRHKHMDKDLIVFEAKTTIIYE